MFKKSKFVIQVDLLPSEVHQKLAAVLAVGDEGGGERPQLLVERSLSAWEVTWHEVGKSSPTLVLCCGIRFDGEHPPVIDPHIWIVSTNCKQLGPARADADALHLRTSTDLSVKVDEGVLRNLAHAPLFPAVPLLHSPIL